MKLKYVVGVTLTCLALMPGISSAKGCIKGAAVGGVGGHVAGHHGLLGAAAGCVVGRHMANKKDKQDAVNASGASGASHGSSPSNKNQDSAVNKS